MSWRTLITDQLIDGAQYWQLRTMGDGGIIELHPPLKIDGKEFPLIPSGTYYLVSYDADRKLIGGAKQIEWELPKATPASKQPPTENQIHSDGLDAAFGIDIDTVARQELEQRKLGENQRQTLDYYNMLMRTVGARGVQEVADKTAQTETFVRFAHKMVEDYISLLERTTERMQRFQAPPPPPEPPPWDRILAAVAPSVAVIYTETVRAIKGTPSTGSGAELEGLLLPPTGQSQIYEVLGQVGSPEKLAAVLKDKDKLAAWMAQIQDILKAKPQSEDPAKVGSEAKSP